MIRLTDAARESVGRQSAAVHQSLTAEARFLLALSAKAARTGSPVYAGIPAAEKDRRRAAGRRQRAARRVNRP